MPLSAADAAHLIRRTGFGVTGPGFDDVRGRSRSAAVERVLDVSRAGGAVAEWPALGLFLTRQLDLQMLQRLWLDRMANAQVPLLEKLTLFWHGHFVSATDKVADLNLLRNQNAQQRRLALGGFVDLLQAMSVDPAMLIYLDNWTNVAGAPQENFGREVLEVFTMGPAARTEADVVSMTRAWTGHGLNTPLLGAKDGAPGFTYQFHPALHDGGTKQLFGGPARRWDGPAALAEVVTRSRREETARFIAAKLFSFLAYPITAADPIAGRLGEVFSRNGLNIGKLVEAILLTEEFWGPSARFALVRSPVEWVVAAMQATGQSALTLQPDAVMPQMGQELFHPPSVAGWGQNEYWLSTSSTWAKAAVARQLRKVVGGSNGVMSDTVDRSPVDAVSRAFAVFGVVTPTPATRHAGEALVARLRAAGKGDAVPGALTHLVLLSPDFQLA